MMLSLLLVGMLALAFKIDPAKGWTGTVYIRTNGSIDPPDAPISTVDYVTYTLTGNITSDVDGVVVEKSNIVINGNGYAVQNRRASLEARNGIYLYSIDNVIIKNTSIKGFECGVYLNSSNNNSASGNDITDNYYGICLYHSSNNSVSGKNMANDGYGIKLDSSSNNTISGNNITNKWDGIGLYGSSNNSIFGNNITRNSHGISLWYSSSHNSIFGNNIAYNEYGIYLCSSGNKFYHNNFIHNSVEQVYCYASYNIWDDGYPSGGNYWDNISGRDWNSGPYQNKTGSDGIWDYPYVTNEDNTDRYPLVNPCEVPEFTSAIILPLCILATLITTVLLKKERKTKPQLP
jgi:parallel beta-helix repeat protein